MVKERLEYYAELVEDAFDKYLPDEHCMHENVIKAARYSLAAGGKRIRPALVMEFCRVCGEEPEHALPVAVAIEMIHTFSLIHDDLPCMDDDDMRRGKPSCHKVYGEATALLAGDMLTVLPFRIISQAAEKRLLDERAALKIISLLAERVGVYGMIGGQVIDTENEGKQLPEAQLLDMYLMKTGALLDFSCRAGCIAAGAGADKQLMAGEYAKKLGLAFQIIDDILDVTADETTLGKPVGSDAESGKFTYVTAVGLEKAREKAEKLTEQALKALDSFEDTEFLRELTMMLLKRNY